MLIQLLNIYIYIYPNKLISFGVPQCIFLDPSLYSLYITLISRIFHNYTEIIYYLYLMILLLCHQKVSLIYAIG